jgi:hypothetical protein
MVRFPLFPPQGIPAPHRVFRRPLGPFVGSGGVLIEMIDPEMAAGTEESVWQEMSPPPPPIDQSS